jgi:iron-sulfur cluster repair protein YtfE (RIC family)
MAGIGDTLTEFHRCCDRLLAAVDGPLGQGDWPAAQAAFARYRQSMERLMGMEDDVLFPAYERQSGKEQGPTRVLRFEHARLRELLDELEGALARADAPASGALRGRLAVSLHEHWQKEERLMFPMADELLAGEARRLTEQLRCLGVE